MVVWAVPLYLACGRPRVSLLQGKPRARLGLGSLLVFSAGSLFFSRGRKKGTRSKAGDPPPPLRRLRTRAAIRPQEAAFRWPTFFVFFGGPKAPGLWCFFRAAGPPVCARAPRVRSRREGGRGAPTRVRTPPPAGPCFRRNLVATWLRVALYSRKKRGFLTTTRSQPRLGLVARCGDLAMDLAL